MTILADHEIAALARAGMIRPFEPAQVRERDGRRVISFGLSSFGYDARVSDDWRIFTNVNSTVVDPKAFDPRCFVEHRGAECIIPPNSFALASTIEYFHIPRDITVVCVGKSTYARCGIVVNVTPIEAGFEGEVTLEFSNTTPLPAKVYSGEGACQMLFFRGSECRVSYAEGNRKYQFQRGVTAARV